MPMRDYVKVPAKNSAGVILTVIAIIIVVAIVSALFIAHRN
jgi:hypothetical protein